jgi:hypothetical protein
LVYNIVIGGYNASGFIMNNPWGESFQIGYENRRTGASFHDSSMA